MKSCSGLADCESEKRFNYSKNAADLSLNSIYNQADLIFVHLILFCKKKKKTHKEINLNSAWYTIREILFEPQVA